ncbi:MAG TPA: response regulator [Permianibacter sp.]|nr:response regulator [Permianibacter sp.]
MTVRKVLLVEDDNDQLHALKLLMAALLPDANILAVPDGFNALAIGPNFQPDLIITDLAMPQADGLTFLHALLPQLNQRPKMLVLTAYDRMQLQRFGPLPEDARFLQKPITIDSLHGTLADWL